MKYLFKVILLFFVVFNFKFPVVHYSCTAAIFIAGIYYLFFNQSFTIKYFSNRYCAVILAGTLVLTFIDVLISNFHGNAVGGSYKRYLVEGWMLACLAFVLPILIDNEESAFNEAIAVICGAFALQGLIHTLGFLIPPFGEFLVNFQSDVYRSEGLSSDRMNYFRLYSLTGAPFFDLPAAYGFACIMFFRLQLVPNQNYLRGWKAFVVIVLMLLGISLSGRTGFTGFALGLAFYLYYNWSKFSTLWKNIIEIAGGYLCLLAVFYVALTPVQRNKIVDDVFPFAFEAYYNWRNNGKFGTGSSDQMMEYHYYHLETSTILWGESLGSVNLQRYHSTDAGYMNILIFGGIFYFLALIIYQLIYFWTPMKLARKDDSKNGKIDFFGFFILFAYFFILEYKGRALGYIHTAEVIVLYYGISYLSERYALEDAVEEEETSGEELLEKPAIV